ncbi:hypothetical protein C8F01DRAFT_1058411, partial [Mycena amicta]
MSSDCPVQASPDIAGIGVRAAIYSQCMFSFVPVIEYLWDGHISVDEITRQSISQLAVAFAVVASTILQAAFSFGGEQVDGLHAAVALDLAWMNNTSTWIWFLLYVLRLSTKPEGEDAPNSNNNNWFPCCPVCRATQCTRPISATWSAWAPVIFCSKTCSQHGQNQRSMPIITYAWDHVWKSHVLMLGSCHLSLMSAFGIWLWLNPQRFLSDVMCVPTYTILGIAVPLSSLPMCIFSVVLYFMLVIPGINLLLLGIAFLGLHTLSNGLWKPRTSVDEPKISTTSLHMGLVFLIFLNMFFMFDIELSLARNHQSVGDEVW